MTVKMLHSDSLSLSLSLSISFSLSLAVCLSVSLLYLQSLSLTSHGTGGDSTQSYSLVVYELEYVTHKQRARGGKSRTACKVSWGQRWDFPFQHPYRTRDCTSGVRVLDWSLTSTQGKGKSKLA